MKNQGDLTEAYNAASRLKPGLDALANAPGSGFIYSIKPYSGVLMVWTNLICDVAPENDSDVYVPTLHVEIHKDGSMYSAGDEIRNPDGTYTEHKAHVKKGEDVKPIIDLIKKTARRHGLVR